MAKTLSEHVDTREELLKEALTMALYVTLCLLAALAAVTEHDSRQVDAFKLVWGTTIGLALAHWFAFRISSRLVGAGTIRRQDAAVGLAQLAGAAAVAVLSTAAIVLFSSSAELDAVRLVLAGVVAGVAFGVARSAGASRARGLSYALIVLTFALGIAIAKNAMSGH